MDHATDQHAPAPEHAPTPMVRLPSLPGPIAGWLIFTAGTAMLVAATLVPAGDDLAGARWQRDKALALEAHALERIARHERYLLALDRHEPRVIEALAGAQLNLVPAGRSALVAPGRPSDLDLFGAIEPPAAPMPARPQVDSRLQRLTEAPTTRLWVIAGAALAVLVGLLPPARR